MNPLELALERFPRIPLTRVPTPLHALRNLSRVSGPEIWLKRDDLTDLSFGGDKARKLEYELAAARAANADIIVSCGSAQSNFARLLAAAARHVGIDCALVLSRDRHPSAQGNRLVTALLGARVRMVDADDLWALHADVERLAGELRHEGRAPYIIPISGTTALSCLGYVRAGLELARQMTLAEVVPDAIYLPFGTGGIFTGIAVAFRFLGLSVPLIGVSVNRDRQGCALLFDALWVDVHSLLGLDETDKGAVEIHDGFVGAGYGDPTDAAMQAIVQFARCEGVILDPVYSGKTAAAVLAHTKEGRWDQSNRIVLLHSGGGPAIFAYHKELTEYLERMAD